MAEIYPFRALHYDAKKLSDLKTVVTQPYDKITPDMQARYYGLSPYNLVRIIRGRQNPTDTPQDNVYTRAARDFLHWIESGILISESEPAIYPYYQEYPVPGEPKTTKQRRGFIALCRLEDYARGIIYRHEETLAGPKADRLELLKTARAHFGQIFVLYSDPVGAIETELISSFQDKPWQTVQDEYGTRHTVHRISDPLVIEKVVISMRDKKLVIADGHHRYETALAYRDYCRARALPDDRPEYVMMTFIRAEGGGLTVLPTHRLVHSLPRFDWQEFIGNAHQFFSAEEFRVQGPVEDWKRRFLDALAEAGRQQPSIGVYAGRSKLAILRLRADVRLENVLAEVPPTLRRLDVILLHRLLIERVLGIDRQAVREERNLRYAREFEDAVRQTESQKAQVSFLMHPTRVEDVWSNALAGHFLPQKSTDFYPKLLSGLTIYWLDNPAGM